MDERQIRNQPEEAEMKANTNRSWEWNVFNAAIRFLQERKLARQSFGLSKEGEELGTEEIFQKPEAVVCACAVGGIYGGAGLIGAYFHDARVCERELDELADEKTRGECNAFSYNDRKWVRKGDVIRLYTILRDRHS